MIRRDDEYADLEIEIEVIEPEGIQAAMHGGAA